jgi:transcriptional regulator with XRE-family HTH domain
MQLMTNILTKYRQDNNVTLEALGEAVGGVNKSTVLRWEEGKVPVDRLADVERVTGIPRAQLRPDIFGATA